MWIGLSGYARSGKDTVADFVQEHDPSFKRVALADSLKEMIYTLDPYVIEEGHTIRYRELVDAIGLHEAKNNHEVRRLLQVFGTEVMRDRFGESVWIDLAFAPYSSPDNLLVTDVRYVNEADAVRDHGGVVIRVERPGVEPPNLHRSETAMADYRFDAVIVNDGTLEDLKAKVVEFVDRRWP